jgi:hypothetical protein
MVSIFNRNIFLISLIILLSRNPVKGNSQINHEKLLALTNLIYNYHDFIPEEIKEFVFDIWRDHSISKLNKVFKNMNDIYFEKKGFFKNNYQLVKEYERVLLKGKLKRCYF